MPCRTPMPGIMMKRTSWAADVQSDRTPGSWWLQGGNVYQKRKPVIAFANTLRLVFVWQELVSVLAGATVPRTVLAQQSWAPESCFIWAVQKLRGLAMNNFKGPTIQPCWVEFFRHSPAIRLQINTKRLNKVHHPFYLSGPTSYCVIFTNFCTQLRKMWQQKNVFIVVIFPPKFGQHSYIHQSILKKFAARY